MPKTAIESVLDCASWHEAQNVIDRLVGKGLIQGAEILTASTDQQIKLIFTHMNEDIEQIKDELTSILRRSDIALYNSRG